MVKIEFNDAEERKMKAMTELALKVEFSKTPTANQLRHLEILQRSVARMIQHKIERLPF